MSLASQAVLVRLSVELFQQATTDKVVTQEVNDHKKAARKAGRYVKQLFTPEALEGLVRVVTQARSLLRRDTVPWDMSGVHLLALKKWESFNAEMFRLEQEFAALRQQRESERNALFAQREAVFREASSRAVRVVVDQPGFVVFSFDGFEGRFSPGDAPEELWQAVAETPDIHSVADGAQVRSGDTLFRLIDGFMGYVFVVFDEAPLVEQGESVRLRWPGGDPAGTPARVHSIHNRPGQVGIWFAVEVSQDPFSSVRVLPEVTVVTRRVEGIVVPRSALIMRNGRPGLYLVASGSPVFRYVTVRAVDDHQAVVDPVPAGTPVIINPRRLTRDAEPYVP